MKKPILINVVSGKGGTGKSLLCAVLARLIAQENARVLLVDFDLFVRGLSHFYYIFIKEKRKITNRKTVSDYFDLSNSDYKLLSNEEEFAKEKFYEVDILPAVKEIEEQLNYLNIESDTVEKTRQLLKILVDDNESLDARYDYIIIDNRAGVDELILETSKISDITLSVTESDPISKTTNENLLRHLNSASVGKVYTIVNKMKYLKTYDDYEKSMESIRSDFNVLGHIPFDQDLFESFGTDRFWDTANSTRYAFSLSETWNKMANRESFKHSINMKRFPRHDLWPGGTKSPVFLNKFERLSAVMSISCVIAYFMYDFASSGKFEWKDIFLIYAIILAAAPMFRRLWVSPGSSEKKPNNTL